MEWCCIEVPNTETEFATHATLDTSLSETNSSHVREASGREICLNVDQVRMERVKCVPTIRSRSLVDCTLQYTARTLES